MHLGTNASVRNQADIYINSRETRYLAIADEFSQRVVDDFVTRRYQIREGVTCVSHTHREKEMNTFENQRRAAVRSRENRIIKSQQDVNKSRAEG